jgi:hypothetical protein
MTSAQILSLGTFLQRQLIWPSLSVQRHAKSLAQVRGLAYLLEICEVGKPIFQVMSGVAARES